MLTQWGLRLSLERLRTPDAMQLLAARGVEEPWQRSIAEAIAVIDLLDERIAPLERELRQLAKADPRVALLDTIPGVGDLLGLTLATEIGDVARFASPRKLSATPVWPRRSTSPATARGPAHYRRRARARCAGRPSKPPTRRGARAIRGTSSTAPSWRARARTRPSPRSRAKCSSPPGTSSRANSRSSRPRRAPPTLPRQAPAAFWPPDRRACN
jgi:transposase